MIWKYGPVKIREYNLSYSYPYLDPGVVTLPPARLVVDGKAFTGYVEAEFEKNLAPNTHPDSLVARRASLIVTDSSISSNLTVLFEGRDGSIDLRSLPDDGDLVLWVEVLSALKDAYEKSGLPEDPKLS